MSARKLLTSKQVSETDERSKLLPCIVPEHKSTSDHNSHSQPSLKHQHSRPSKHRSQKK